MATTVDAKELEAKVKDMYRHVAEEPDGDYHFELGRTLAARLGYPSEVLDQVPEGAIESFAGVGYFFDLAELHDGESVIDLGSGSGMDVFFAAQQVGPNGHVVGVDFTVEQLEKARALASAAGIGQVELQEGRIDALPVEDESFDCVISNGVINLSPEKDRVFAEAARVLRPGGRLAIADIVSERELIERTRRNVALWAACIAGAVPQEDYLGAIEAAGLRIETVRANGAYRFLSPRARVAADKYGVASVTVLATKPIGP
jgi:SAM-dependent methyltransferase